MKFRLLMYAVAVAGLVLAGCVDNDDTDPDADSHSGSYDSFSYGGQTYKTVKIGTQTWMAENLNYQTPDSSWCYDNTNSNCTTYGRLYAWNAAKTACESLGSGWHLPDTSDWNKLVIAAGGTAGHSNTGAQNLKSRSWDNGTNSLGFSALSGGDRYPSGTFNGLGSWGNWWTATEDGSSSAYRRILGSGNAYVYERSNFDKNYGCSVRCMKY